MFPLSTTLNRIQAAYPDPDLWKKLLEAMGEFKCRSEPISYSEILDVVSFKDALWCCRAEPRYGKLWRLFAVRCVQEFQYLLPENLTVKALRVAEAHVRGEATNAELRASEIGARHVAERLIFSPARTSWFAAEAAAYSATEYIHSNVNNSSVSIASAAAEAAKALAVGYNSEDDGSSAWNSTWNSVRKTQADVFRQIVISGYHSN